MMVLLKARTAASVALALSCSAGWLGDRAASFMLVGRGPPAAAGPTARARAQQGIAATAQSSTRYSINSTFIFRVI